MFNVILGNRQNAFILYIVAIVAAVMSIRKTGLEAKASLPFKSKADRLPFFPPTPPRGVCEHDSSKVHFKMKNSGTLLLIGIEGTEV